MRLVEFRRSLNSGPFPVLLRNNYNEFWYAHKLETQIKICLRKYVDPMKYSNKKSTLTFLKMSRLIKPIPSPSPLPFTIGGQDFLKHPSNLLFQKKLHTLEWWGNPRFWATQKLKQYPDLLRNEIVFQWGKVLPHNAVVWLFEKAYRMVIIEVYTIWFFTCQEMPTNNSKNDAKCQKNFWSTIVLLYEA